MSKNSFSKTIRNLSTKRKRELFFRLFLPEVSPNTFARINANSSRLNGVNLRILFLCICKNWRFSDNGIRALSSICLLQCNYLVIWAQIYKLFLILQLFTDKKGYFQIIVNRMRFPSPLKIRNNVFN